MKAIDWLCERPASRAGLVLALGGLAAVAGKGRWVDSQAELRVVQGAPFVAGDKFVTSVVATGQQPGTAGLDGGVTLQQETVDIDGDVTTRVRTERDEWLTVTRSTEPTVNHLKVLNVEFWVALLTIVLLLAVAYCLPGAFGPASARPQGQWEALLTDADGSFSLARVQLLIWFLPAATIFGGMSIVCGRFMPVDSQLSILLGLSGVTAVLGSATNPSRPPGGPVVAPKLSDLVQDFNAQSDLSRYQYLLISIIGALTLVVGFIHGHDFPRIPSQLLYLVAASQGTYVGAKAVRASRSDANAFIPAAVVTLAPQRIQPLAARPDGEVRATVSPLGTDDGSFIKPGQGTAP